MKSKKSKIIIIISIIVIILIAITIGLILFLTTDIFKSNQELFFKYAIKNDVALQMLEKNKVNNLEQAKYSTTGEITFNLISNNPELANQTIPARNFKIEYNAKTDKEQNNTSAEATLKYLTKDLFTLKYIKDGDKYALKSDEVMNKYLAFQNNNLKEYINKLGVQDVNNIPNKVQSMSLEELFYISQEDKNVILEKYIEVINTKIPKKNYTKTKQNITINNNTYMANAYILQITNEQYKEVKTAILENIMNDEMVLNILISKIKLIDENSDINAEKIKTFIQEILNKEDNTDYGTRKITIYEKDGELLRTLYEDTNGDITLDFAKTQTAKSLTITNNYEIVKQPVQQQTPIDDEFDTIQDATQNNNTQNNQTHNKIKVKSLDIAKEKKEGNVQTIIILTLEVNEKPVKLAIQSVANENVENADIENKTVININIADETYFTTNIKQTSTIQEDIQIEKLDNNNSAIINNFTVEYTNQLLTAIKARLNQIYQEKRILATQVQATQNQTNENNQQNQENANQQIENQIPQNEISQDNQISNEIQNNQIINQVPNNQVQNSTDTVNTTINSI